MIIAALIIGALAGTGTILIRWLIKGISAIRGVCLRTLSRPPWYVKLIVPTLGSLIVGPIIYFFAREAKRPGVPEVMQSILIRGGYIRLRKEVFFSSIFLL